MPAVRHGPQRGVGIATAAHDLAQQLSTAKVESLRAGRVRRRPVEAVGLSGNDVEPRRSAGLVEVVQVSDIALVQSTRLGVGRQRSGQDGGIRVGRAQLDGRLAQQSGVLGGIDQVLAPVRLDIRLVPDLIEAKYLPVAFGEGLCEAAEVGAPLRRRQRVVGILRRPCPTWRAV